MKRFVFSFILASLISAQAHGQAPHVYINGLTHTAAGLPQGVTTSTDFIQSKENAFAPSFHVNSAIVTAHHKDPAATDYVAAVTTMLYNLSLDALLPGLYAQAWLPIVGVSNKAGIGPDYDILLNKAGFGDISLVAGYHALDANDEYSVTVSGDVVLPVLYEKSKQLSVQSPSIGNGGHLALGLAVAGDLNLVGTKEHGLSLSTETKYHYEFDALNQNLLGVTPSNQVLSRVTTQGGNLLDLSSSLIYTYKQIFVGVGTAYQFRDSRTVVADDNNVIGNKAVSRAVLNGTTFSLNSVSGSSATTPAQHALKVNGSVGLAATSFNAPLFFNIPASVYMSLDASTTVFVKNYPEVWDITIKSGFTF